MTCDHRWKPVDGKGYYKRDGDRMTSIGMPAHDQTVAYTMLYCERCSDTKEVILSDHRATSS